MVTVSTTLRSLIYASGFVLLWGWIAFEVRVFDQRFGLLLPDWTAIPGILFIVSGGIVALTCLGFFVKTGKGTPAPFDPPKEFVAIGPYKYVRNPMYIGGLIVLVGFGLYHRSVSIVLLALFLFPVLHLFVLFVEEPDLQNRFGQSYMEYKESMNRWMPRFRS